MGTLPQIVEDQSGCLIPLDWGTEAPQMLILRTPWLIRGKTDDLNELEWVQRSGTINDQRFR